MMDKQEVVGVPYEIENVITWNKQLKIKFPNDKDNVVLALVNSGYKVTSKYVDSKKYSLDGKYWLITYEEGQD